MINPGLLPWCRRQVVTVCTDEPQVHAVSVSRTTTRYWSPFLAPLGQNQLVPGSVVLLRNEVRSYAQVPSARFLSSVTSPPRRVTKLWLALDQIDPFTSIVYWVNVPMLLRCPVMLTRQAFLTSIVGMFCTRG
jgi:hypothetical protein